MLSCSVISSSRCVWLNVIGTAATVQGCDHAKVGVFICLVFLLTGHGQPEYYLHYSWSDGHDAQMTVRGSW